MNVFTLKVHGEFLVIIVLLSQHLNNQYHPEARRVTEKKQARLHLNPLKQSVWRS